MTKEEIKGLINSNEVIASAYKEFKNKCQYRKIIDMWEQVHLTKPIEEACIKYVDYLGYTKTFNYCNEL